MEATTRNYHIEIEYQSVNGERQQETQELIELNVKHLKTFDEYVVNAVIVGGKLRDVTNQDVYDSIVEVVMVRQQNFFHLLNPNTEVRLPDERDAVAVIEYVAADKFLTASEKRRLKNRGDAIFYVPDRQSGKSVVCIRWQSYESRQARLTELEAIVLNYVRSVIQPSIEDSHMVLTDSASSYEDDGSLIVDLNYSCMMWVIKEMIVRSPTYRELTAFPFGDERQQSKLDLLLRGYAGQQLQQPYYKLQFGTLIVGLPLISVDDDGEFTRHPIRDIVYATMVQIYYFSVDMLARSSGEQSMKSKLKAWAFEEIEMSADDFQKSGGVAEELYPDSSPPSPLFDHVDVRYQSDSTASPVFPLVTDTFFKTQLQPLLKTLKPPQGRAIWKQRWTVFKTCNTYANRQNLDDSVTGYFESTPGLLLKGAEPFHLESIQPTLTTTTTESVSSQSNSDGGTLVTKKTERGICRLLRPVRSGALFKPFASRKVEMPDEDRVASMKTFLEDYGFALLRDVVPMSTASHIASEMWTLLTELYVGSSKISQHDSSSWKNMPKPSNMALLNIDPSYHLESSWKELRQNPRLYNLFSQLIPGPLSPSIEGIITTHRQRHEGSTYPYRWNLKEDRHVLYRGLLALDDMTGENAALLLIPEAHKESVKRQLLNEDESLLQRSQLHSHINVGGRSYKTAPDSIVHASKEFNERALCIPMKKGDFVIWDHRLPYTIVRSADHNVIKFAQFITFVKSDCSDSQEQSYINLLRTGGMPQRDLDGILLSDLPLTNTRTNAPAEYKKARNSDWIWKTFDETAGKRKQKPRWIYKGYTAHDNSRTYNENWSWDESLPITEQAWQMTAPDRATVIKASYTPPLLSEFGRSLLRGVPCDRVTPVAPIVPIVEPITLTEAGSKKRKRAPVSKQLSSCSQKVLEGIAAESLFQLFDANSYHVENSGLSWRLETGSVYKSGENIVVSAVAPSISARPEVGDSVRFVLYMKSYDGTDSAFILHSTAEWQLTADSGDAVTKLLWVQKPRRSVRYVRFSLPIATVVDVFIKHVLPTKTKKRRRKTKKRQPREGDPFDNLMKITKALSSDITQVYKQPDSTASFILKQLENIESGIQKKVDISLIVEAIEDTIGAASKQLLELKQAESTEAVILRSVRDRLLTAQREFLEEEESLFENFRAAAIYIFQDFLATRWMLKNKTRSEAAADLNVIAEGAVANLVQLTSFHALLSLLDAVDRQLEARREQPASRLRRRVVSFITAIRDRTEESITTSSSIQNAYRTLMGLIRYLNIKHESALDFAAWVNTYIVTGGVVMEELETVLEIFQRKLSEQRQRLTDDSDDILLNQSFRLSHLLNEIIELISSETEEEIGMEEDAIETAMEEEPTVFTIEMQAGQGALQQELFEDMDRQLSEALQQSRKMLEAMKARIEQADLPTPDSTSLIIQLETTETMIEKLIRGEISRCKFGATLDSLKSALTSSLSLSEQLQESLLSSVTAIENLIDEAIRVVPASISTTTTTTGAEEDSPPLPDINVDDLLEEGEHAPPKTKNWRLLSMEEEEEEL